MTTNAIPGTTVPARKSTAGQKFEGVVLVLILLTVGGFAGAASFTHVHDWTMTNSPTNTGGWFGWANAVVSELVPIAALLVMRRRRAAGQPFAYPAALLVGALILSITAQLAVAKPGFFGGLVSVVPALAFAALAKLVLGKTTTHAADTVPDALPGTVPAVPAAPGLAVIVPDRPNPTPAVPGTVPDTVPVPAVARPEAVPPQVIAPPVAPASVPQVPTEVTSASPANGDRPAWPVPPLPATLLDAARDAAARYHAEHGKPITRNELQKSLRVSNATTGDVMRTLGLRDSRTGDRTVPSASANGAQPDLFATA